MRPSKARFVTACQQLLALGVVLAVLTPAASVISLDVVRRRPALRRRPGPGRPRSRRTRGMQPDRRCSPARSWTDGRRSTRSPRLPAAERRWPPRLQPRATAARAGSHAR